MIPNLNDPIAAEHPDLIEHHDWRSRGSQSDLVSDLWHAGDGDFGAYTRFGLGWGPVEVIRAARHDHDGTPVRVIDVRSAGETAVSVHVIGDGERVLILEGENVITAGAPENAAIASSPDPEPPAAITMPNGAVRVRAEVIDELKHLSLVIQRELTANRREKRYVPKTAIESADEIHRLLGKI